MKITIVTVGTRGDVEPFVALGERLQQDGHAVKIATRAMFESFVRGYGLDFAIISGDVQEAINSDEAREALEKSETSFGFLLQVRDKAGPLVLTAVKEVAEACKGADHIMCTPLTLYIAYFTAKEFSIPISVGCVNPAGPTRYFHNVVCPPAAEWLPSTVKKAYNVLSHVVIGELVWFGERPFLNKAWQEVYGHKLPVREPLGAAFKKNPPLMLYAYSKHVLPKPADWAPIQHVTGYWFLKSRREWNPAPELEQFLAAGEKPLYIGFGSMNNNQYKNGAVKNMILDTLKKTGKRAVLLNEGLGLTENDLNENILAAGPVPFEYLFPRMAAVIHHGGAGTTAAGLRAGVPSVITPLIFDQRFWSWCVEKIGVGTKPIAWNKLGVDNLSSAIQAALHDNVMQNKAGLIGQEIRAENGVEEAVKLFHWSYC